VVYNARKCTLRGDEGTVMRALDSVLRQ